MLIFRYVLEQDLILLITMVWLLKTKKALAAAGISSNKIDLSLLPNKS